MSIICPSCDTGFVISKEQLGSIGRKVKCSKCQYTWYQPTDFITNNQFQEVENIQQKEPPISNNTVNNTGTKPLSSNQNLVYPSKGINLPALLPLKLPQHSYIAPILLTNLIFLLLFILFHEKFNFLALPKFHNNSLLAIDNIQVEQNSTTKQIKVSYRITNNYNYDITIPLIRIRLLDKNLATVKSYILEQKNIKLLPKQHIEINTNFDSIPASSNSLDIMLGNNLDFILQ